MRGIKQYTESLFYRKPLRVRYTFEVQRYKLPSDTLLPSRRAAGIIVYALEFRLWDLLLNIKNWMSNGRNGRLTTSREFEL